MDVAPAYRSGRQLTLHDQADLAKIQADFVKEQGARSMTHVREVGDMIAQFGRDTMAAWRPKKD